MNAYNVEVFPGIPSKDLKKIKKFIKDLSTIKISILPKAPFSLKQLFEMMNSYDKSGDAFKRAYKKLM